MRVTIPKEKKYGWMVQDDGSMKFKPSRTAITNRIEYIVNKRGARVSFNTMGLEIHEVSRLSEDDMEHIKEELKSIQ